MKTSVTKPHYTWLHTMVSDGLEFLPFHHKLFNLNNIGLREVVIKLLKHGADPNLRGKGGQTVLHILIDKALRNLSNSEKKNHDVVEAIRKLLDIGCHSSMDVNAEDLNSKTPLHIAVSCGIGMQITHSPLSIQF